MVDIRESNPKAFEELDLKLQELQGYETRVGWGSEKKYEDGTSVAYVAQIQELGPHMRPFMRPAAIKYKNDWIGTAMAGAQRILAGKLTGQGAMELLGVQVAGDIKQSIEDVYKPPLSLITLWARYYKRRKGQKIGGAFIGELAKRTGEGGDLTHPPPGISDKPLIDTGTMINDIESITTSAS